MAAAVQLVLLAVHPAPAAFQALAAVPPARAAAHPEALAAVRPEAERTP